MNKGNKVLIEDGSYARLSRFCLSSATPTTVVTARSNTLGSCNFSATTKSSILQSVESPRITSLSNGTRDANKLDFNRFCPVLKGDYITYRRKYLEGPVVGRGSFGEVRSLFSLVDLLALQQHLPVKLQLPANRLAEGIKVLPNNQYEFCGLSLCPPTRAVKIMNLYQLHKSRDSKDFAHVLRELSIGSWIDHPDIVKITEIHSDCFDLIPGANGSNAVEGVYSKLTEDSKVYLVMEYCSGGDLTSRKINEATKEETIGRMFLHIFRALSYINSLGIAHRDVKPENFLWTDTSPNAGIKLADFGLANNPMDPLKTRAGTAYYVAPEIVKYAPKMTYSTKCDSWSAGIMLHVFLLGSCPYHAETDAKTLCRVANDEIDWSSECYANLPPDAHDLLSKLLVKDPNKRISTTEALHHPWIARVALNYTEIPMSVEQVTGIVDKLATFYQFPVLKQLTLSLMVRQMQDSKIEEWRRRYLYLSAFCGNERFVIDLDSVEQWLMHSHSSSSTASSMFTTSAATEYGSYGSGIATNGHMTTLAAAAAAAASATTAGVVTSNTVGSASESLGYNFECLESDACACVRCMPRKRRTSLRRMSLFKSVQKLSSVAAIGNHIGITEFVAAQMAPILCKQDDLIADIFAGLRSDIPGRRCILLDVRDLKRLVNPLCGGCSEQLLEQVLQEAGASALSSHVENAHDCNGCKIHDFYRQVAKSSDESPINLSIEEFFILIKHSNDAAIGQQLFRGRCRGSFAQVKRKVLIEHLYQDYAPKRSKKKKA